MSQEKLLRKLKLKQVNRRVAHVYIFMAIVIGFYAYFKNDYYYILSATLLIIALIRIYLSKN